MMILDQLITQVIATNAYKNEVFAATSKAVNNLQDKVETKVNELTIDIKHLEQINSSIMDSLLVAESKGTKQRNSTPVKRNPRHANQETTTPIPANKSQTRQKASPSPNVNNYVGKTSPYDKEKARKPSPNRSKSPQTQPNSARNKSASAEKRSRPHEQSMRKNATNSRSRDLFTEKDREGLLYELKKSKTYHDQYVVNMERKLQKLDINARKLMSSSVKVAGLLRKRNEEEVYALKLYKHDYKLLEDSLNKLYSVYTVSTHERKMTPVRSVSQDLKKSKSKSLKKLLELQNSAESLEKKERRYLTLEDEGSFQNERVRVNKNIKQPKNNVLNRNLWMRMRREFHLLLMNLEGED